VGVQFPPESCCLRWARVAAQEESWSQLSFSLCPQRDLQALSFLFQRAVCPLVNGCTVQVPLAFSMKIFIWFHGTPRWLSLLPPFGCLPCCSWSWVVAETGAPPLSHLVTLELWWPHVTLICKGSISKWCPIHRKQGLGRPPILFRRDTVQFKTDSGARQGGCSCVHTGRCPVQEIQAHICSSGCTGPGRGRWV
jgi:hypothetical protein